jgi:alcohol dehydrogenase class IV
VNWPSLAVGWGRQPQRAYAEVHTLVLPQTIDFNVPATPEAMTRIERAVGAANEREGNDAHCRTATIKTF